MVRRLPSVEDRRRGIAGVDVRAARLGRVGRAAGLHYVYAGNIPGSVGKFENTYCPECGTLVIERKGFRILKNVLTAGACPACRRGIPGIWS